MTSKLSYFQYKSYTFLSYFYYLYDTNCHTSNTSHTAFRCRDRMSERGTLLVLRAHISALPFQFGNCQRAIYSRGIAANRLETHFPWLLDMVLVGPVGRRKTIQGRQETKVTRASSKGQILSDRRGFSATRNAARGFALKRRQCIEFPFSA